MGEYCGKCCEYVICKDVPKNSLSVVYIFLVLKGSKMGLIFLMLSCFAI